MDARERKQLVVVLNGVDRGLLHLGKGAFHLARCKIYPANEPHLVVEEQIALCDALTHQEHGRCLLVRDAARGAQHHAIGGVERAQVDVAQNVDVMD